MPNTAALITALTPMQRIQASWMWYLIRASGLAAMVLLILIMLSGIGHVTGLTYRFIEPVKAWTIHKALSIALGISIALHVLLLLVDKASLFTLKETLVPFAKTFSNGQPLLGFDLAWLSIPSGIIAGYGAYIVLFSSLDSVGWIRTRKRLWAWLHWLSYLVLFMSLIHGILAGTDLKAGWLRWTWLVFTVLMGVAIVSRLMRSSKAAY